MRDAKGVLRGGCQDCNLDDCNDYYAVDPTISLRCDYCGCPPAKHSRLEEIGDNSGDAETMSFNGSEGRSAPSSPSTSQHTNSPVMTPPAANIMVTPPTLNSQAVPPRADNGLNRPGGSTSSLIGGRGGSLGNTPTSASGILGRRRRPGNTRAGPGPYVVAPMQGELPLPCFSYAVKETLEEPDNRYPVTRMWSLIIEECAQHYLKYNIGHPSQYQKIGERLTAKYPILQLEGKRPWSVFTSSLSQKIRTIRFERNKVAREEVALQSDLMDLPMPLARERPKRDRFTGYDPSIATMTRIKAMHLLEWAQHEVNENAITSTLMCTFGLRSSHISGNGNLKYLFDEYPCLKEGKYLMKELGFIITSSKLEEVKKNIQILLSRIKLVENETDPLAAIKKSQEKYCTKKKPLFITISSDDDEYLQLSRCNEKGEPRIVVKWSDEDNEATEFIIPCFGQVITKTGNLESCLATFIATHVSLSLSYSSGFRHLLHVFESFVFGYDIPGIAKKQKDFLTKLKITQPTS